MCVCVCVLHAVCTFYIINHVMFQNAVMFSRLARQMPAWSKRGSERGALKITVRRATGQQQLLGKG